MPSQKSAFYYNVRSWRLSTAAQILSSLMAKPCEATLEQYPASDSELGGTFLVAGSHRFYDMCDTY